MPLENDAVAARVHRYLELVETGTADEVAALFASEATIEDPVGSEVRAGRHDIREFYATFESMTKTTRLISLRACAGQAAFQFEISTEVAEATFATMSPMEVMVFDDDGLIESMRAWWAPDDLTIGPAGD
ncbi:MAG: steroid delta-isomerase [Actinobacteria bacterium]|uniref:Unannotated protein n=1 Tax=freshwater metagenome TaxID=449393 RepID=A0A6J6NM36_9ZZZZ|nr:steroid delta-isomerase [Actinomycetota bacterium]